MKAYNPRYDETAAPVPLRVGCSAEVILRILQADLPSITPLDTSCCVAVLLFFILQVRAVSMAHLSKKDITLDCEKLTVSFFCRKGRSVRRPLILHYGRAANWGSNNSIALVEKWLPSTTSSGPVFSMPLSNAMQRALTLTGVQAPEGCVYSAHSARIGGYNELLSLKFPKKFIMRRLDWYSEVMLCVYRDSRIVVTDPSRWFFAHFRP